jgi:hypothetical protein
MKIKTGMIACILIFMANIAFTQSKDLGFVLGIGIVSHAFTEVDDTREGSTYFNGEDEIEAAAGFQIYAEYFILDYLSLGLKSQALAGGVDYSGTDGKVERRIMIDNSTFYTNLLFPVGSGYWRLGGSAGAGSSKYTVSWEVICNASSSSCVDEKIEESTNGSVAEVGFIVDWGEDASGGRLGYVSSSMTHDKIDDTEIKASGSQFFVDFRYSW